MHTLNQLNQTLSVYSKAEGKALLIAQIKNTLLNKTSPSELSPLHAAVLYGRSDDLQKLLAKDSSPLNYAISAIARVKNILTDEKSPTDNHSTDPRGFSPLDYAILVGDTASVKLLYKHGARLMGKQDKQSTHSDRLKDLGLIALLHDDFELAETLVEFDGQEGLEELPFAVIVLALTKSSIDSARLRDNLVEFNKRGFNRENFQSVLNTNDRVFNWKKLWSATLRTAVCTGEVETARKLRLLIQNGLISGKSKDLSDYAFDEYRINIERTNVTSSIKEARNILQSNFFVEIAHSGRFLILFPKSNLLHTAAGCGNVDIVKLLVSSGFDVKEPDIYGRTPLHYATAARTLHSPTDVITLLTKAGADPFAKDRFVEQPLKALHLKRALSMIDFDELLAFLAGGAKVEAVIDANGYCLSEMQSVRACWQENDHDFYPYNQLTCPALCSSEIVALKNCTGRFYPTELLREIVVFGCVFVGLGNLAFCCCGNVRNSGDALAFIIIGGMSFLVFQYVST